MSIYRRKWRDKATGKQKRAERWTAEFVYRGKLHREGGFPDKDSALHWVNTESLRLRRGGKGYVKPMLNRPLRTADPKAPGMIEQFTDFLASLGRDSMYCTVADERLRRLANECAWVTIGDISKQTILLWRAQPSYWRGRPGQPVSNKTKNQFVQFAIQFCDWLVEPMQLLASNPLKGIKPLPHRDNTDYRRAGTVDELNKLLATCAPERVMYYRFRVYQSKIRARTLRFATWRMAHLDATPPFIKTPADANKSRKEEKHVLRYDVAQELRKLRKRAKADAPIFPNPPTLYDLRDDLKAAGIKFNDEKGNNRLDYHALRATLIDIGKASHLDLWEVHDLLGHKDIRTTMKYYNKKTADPRISEAMEKLPVLGRMRKQA